MADKVKVWFDPVDKGSSPLLANSWDRAERQMPTHSFRPCLTAAAGFCTPSSLLLTPVGAILRLSANVLTLVYDTICRDLMRLVELGRPGVPRPRAEYSLRFQIDEWLI